MEKVVPNGPAIAEARKKKGSQQEDFAKLVGISVRKYRDIENRSLPIPRWQLQEISEKLDASAEGLADNSIEEVPAPTSDREIQLRPVNGTKLLAMAQSAENYEYLASVNFKNGELEIMLPILRIIHAYCRWNCSEERDWPPADGFEDQDFPDLRRIACVNEAIERLRTADIGVLANTYYFGPKHPPETRVSVAFVQSKAKALNVRKSPDAVSSFVRALNDEVPF